MAREKKEAPEAAPKVPADPAKKVQTAAEICAKHRAEEEQAKKALYDDQGKLKVVETEHDRAKRFKEGTK